MAKRPVPALDRARPIAKRRRERRTRTRTVEFPDTERLVEAMRLAGEHAKADDAFGMYSFDSMAACWVTTNSGGLAFLDAMGIDTAAAVYVVGGGRLAALPGRRNAQLARLGIRRPQGHLRTVVCIEPRCGFGVRVEDDALITVGMTIDEAVSQWASELRSPRHYDGLARLLCTSGGWKARRQRKAAAPPQLQVVENVA